MTPGPSTPDEIDRSGLSADLRCALGRESECFLHPTACRDGYSDLGYGNRPEECPDPFVCRITALMGSVVAGAGVNPADQRWGFWPLLPLSYQLQEQA